MHHKILWLWEWIPKLNIALRRKGICHIIRSRNYRIYLIDLFVGIPLKVIIRTIIFALTALIPKTMCSALTSKLISYILFETSFNSLPSEHVPHTSNSNVQEKKMSVYSTKEHLILSLNLSARIPLHWPEKYPVQKDCKFMFCPFPCSIYIAVNDKI